MTETEAKQQKLQKDRALLDKWQHIILFEDKNHPRVHPNQHLNLANELELAEKQCATHNLPSDGVFWRIRKSYSI